MQSRSPITTDNQKAWGITGHMIPVKGGLPILGYKVKKYGTGIQGDKKARWRTADGAGHGMRSMKFIIAKTSNKG